MSLIFNLNDLSRRAVCLEFTSTQENPNVQWKSLAQPIPLNSSTSSLSIRVDTTFVTGLPTLTVNLCHDSSNSDDCSMSLDSSIPSLAGEVPLSQGPLTEKCPEGARCSS